MEHVSLYTKVTDKATACTLWNPNHHYLIMNVYRLMEAGGMGGHQGYYTAVIKK
jgi:hypothetical protein